MGYKRPPTWEVPLLVGALSLCYLYADRQSIVCRDEHSEQQSGINCMHYHIVHQEVQKVVPEQGLLSQATPLSQ